MQAQVSSWASPPLSSHAAGRLGRLWQEAGEGPYPSARLLGRLALDPWIDIFESSNQLLVSLINALLDALMDALMDTLIIFSSSSNES